MVSHNIENGQVIIFHYQAMLELSRCQANRVTGKERKDIYFYDNMNANAIQSEMSSLVCADRKNIC